VRGARRTEPLILKRGSATPIVSSVGADLVELQLGFAASAANAERAVTAAVAGHRTRGGVVVGLSSPAARCVVLGKVRRDGFDEVSVVGAPDVDVCVALGFSVRGSGEWVKISPHDAEAWPGDAAVAVAVLATDINLNRAGIAWRDGRDAIRARAALLSHFGAARQRFALPPPIDQRRLLTYDRDGRLARAVIAVSRSSRIEATSLRHLHECGIHTAADFVGVQVDYLSVRHTSYVIRRDGTPFQIRGIGAERALAFSAWRQLIDAGRAPVFA
jgi:hypothetical protein